MLVLDIMIPSGGILSFLALLALIGGVWIAFRRDLTTGLAVTAITLFAAPIVIGLAFKALPHTPMGRAFLGVPPSAEQAHVDDPRRRLVGRFGMAKSTMLPSGTVLIDGALVDAVSQGGAVDPGEWVIVVEVSANRVVVRRATSEEQIEATASRTDAHPADILQKPLEEFGLDPLDGA